MEIEVGKYYVMTKDDRTIVGKCLKSTPNKCKFHIVFDEVKYIEGENKWYARADVETINKIKDCNIVLEMFK